MINFLNLEYFLVAAEELNFTRAAKKLYISQQSLSSHISNIEKELDILLFHRTTPLTLTFAGKAMVRRANQLLDIKDETIKELSDIKDFSSGELSIGISHTRGRIFLPQILPKYNEKFPNIHLNILEGNSKELDNALSHGSLDLIIGMLPFVVPNIKTTPLCQEEILMIVPDSMLYKYFGSRHDRILSSLNKKMDLELLSNCPFLMTNRGNRIRSVTDAIFEEVQITPNIILETENVETLLGLCIRGMGITFYPKTFIAHSDLLQNIAASNKIHIFSLSENHSHGTLAIGYNKTHYQTKAAKQFICMAQEIF
jgi:Transcriptional regulator